MKHCLIILLLSIFLGTSAQQRLSFEHLTVEDGLANNSVRAVFQDREGYLWFGTLNGLSRYDGQQFKTFTFTSGDSTSISGHKIRDIFQDGAGYLWVTTYNDHAHRFDPRSESFVNFPAALGPSYEGCSVHAVYESSPGVIWLTMTGKGCVRIISRPEAPEYSLAWFGPKSVLPSASVNFVRSGKDGDVWIGTSAGLCYLPDDRIAETEAQRAVKFLTDPAYNVMVLLQTERATWVGCQTGEVFKLAGNDAELFWKTPEWGGTNNTISFIVPAGDGKLCVGSRKGLLMVDETAGAWSHLTTRNSNMVTSYLISCFPDSYGDLWLVNSRRGVTRFQPGKNTFTHYELQPEIRQSIREGEKQVFREDRNRDVWVGIYGGGLSRFNRQTEQFEQFLHEENNPGSLSSNLILSVFEDRSGNIWAGTYKRGLNKISLRRNSFHFKKSHPGADRDFSYETRAIFRDSRNWIWTGNKKGELAVYDANMTLLFTGDQLSGLGPETIGTGIYTFEEDREHHIWIGTKGNGIFVIQNLPSSAGQIRSARLQISHIQHEAADPRSLSHNDIFDLHPDQLGQMWVACYHGGLNVIQNPLQPQQQILQYRENENDRFALSDDRVRCIFEDRDGNMWIGTANGLNFLSARYRDASNKKFRVIERSSHPQALSNNDVISVVQDSESRIWVGTSGGGLNRLLKESTEPSFLFDHIGEEDGLPSSLIMGIVEDDRKNLWIGTDFGLCKYNPVTHSLESFYERDGLEENSFSEGCGTATSSGLLVFGDISGMIWFDPDSIRKSERQIPVVLTNLLINGAGDRDKLNRARSLLGDSLRSLKLKHDENFLTLEFAGLDFSAPEKISYMFKLENYEDNWNRSGNLNMAIYRDLQPGTYLFRMKASNSDGLWVNPELKLSLTIAPPPWRAWWAYVLYVLMAAGLFSLARRFVLERIRLKHEVEFEKKLSEDKLRFYTSISHEFKTPLALIMGPVEDLLDGNKLPPSAIKPLQLVRKNTHRLLELIEQLMDFRKIQKGFFRVSPVTGDLVLFLDEIYRIFVPLAEKQQTTFNYVHDMPELTASVDYKTLEKIIFNLLSNAFKHTGPGKGVELKLTIEKERHLFTIAVTDEGEGIREQDLPHIFERFSLGNNSRWKDESGTGVGLSLTKELVELLQGTIAVTSAPGQGSIFVVTLPWLDDTTVAAGGSTRAELSYTPKFIQVIDEEPDTAGKNGRQAMARRDKILIVEDNSDLRVYLAGELLAKYEVIQAANGKEGLEAAKSGNPDLIICDIMMPEMDGLELTAILKNEFHTSHIPVILLTARSLEEQKIEGIETGADDYVTKPFNMRYLQTRIANMLYQRRQLRERYSHDPDTGTQELTRSAADEQFLSKLISLIEENMSDPEFSVDTLLRNFSFGRTVFYKKMKGITGYSPKDFVRIVRMRKAGMLLKDRELTVAEAAYEVGFNDPEYFSRLFKKHFGEKPSEYQKKHTAVKYS